MTNVSLKEEIEKLKIIVEVLKKKFNKNLSYKVAFLKKTKKEIIKTLYGRLVFKLCKHYNKFHNKYHHYLARQMKR